MTREERIAALSKIKLGPKAAMPDERLEQLRRVWTDRTIHHPQVGARRDTLELIAEVDHLRARVAELEARPRLIAGWGEHDGS